MSLTNNYRGIPLQAYGITSKSTMYRYLHQRNHLCSKLKLILSINGHKQLLSHTETRNKKFFFLVMNHTSYKSTRYTAVKKLFRLWILAEVRQLFSSLNCACFQETVIILEGFSATALAALLCV